MCIRDRDQLDFPVVYGSAKNGWMCEDYNHPTDNIDYLLDKIIEVIPCLLYTSPHFALYALRSLQHLARGHRGENQHTGIDIVVGR